MKCVYCNSLKTNITNSRPTKAHTQTWRRHYCQDCKRTFSTYEKPDMKHLAIEKSNKLKPYSRSLLELSIIESFRGVELDHQLIDTLADTLEIRLLNLSQSTIAASTVSEAVLKTLKPINKRAYLHYLADRS